jgi:hypothetical protein
MTKVFTGSGGFCGCLLQGVKGKTGKLKLYISPR